MEKEIMASASYYNKKYYLNPVYEILPTQIKNEIKQICVEYVDKFKCILIMGFYEDGEIFFETQVLDEYEFSFMEIDSKLEIRKIEKEYAELLEGLGKWKVMELNKN